MTGGEKNEREEINWKVGNVKQGESNPGLQGEKQV